MFIRLLCFNNFSQLNLEVFCILYASCRFFMFELNRIEEFAFVLEVCQCE